MIGSRVAASASPRASRSGRPCARPTSSLSRKQRRNTAELGSHHGGPVRGLRRHDQRRVVVRPPGTRCSPTRRTPTTRTPASAYREIHAALAKMTQGRAARPHRRPRLELPRPGRHLRLRRRGAAVPARRRAARDPAGRSGSTVESGVKQRVRALEKFLADVYGEQRAVHRRRHPGTAHQLVEPLPPRGGGHRQPRTACASRSRASTSSATSRAPGGCSKTTCACPRASATSSRTAGSWRRPFPSCSSRCGCARSATTRSGCCSRCAHPPPTGSTTRRSSCSRPASTTRRTSSTPCSPA